MESKRSRITPGSNPKNARNTRNCFCATTRVITATIAFGMGINKPNVRFVVHHDLPKNIELLSGNGARRPRWFAERMRAALQRERCRKAKAIHRRKSEREQQIAHEQLRDMIHYAETRECRRATLLKYFGEEFPIPCDGCDNCLKPRETFDGTVAAQKFLVVRIAFTRNTASASA